MKKQNLKLTTTSKSVQTQLTVCAAALAGTAAGIPSADAAVISFTVNASVPQTFAGLYINFATGAITGSPTGNTGWDFNPYSNSGPFAIYWAGGATGIAGGVTTGPGSTTYARLQIGNVVSSASNFSNSLQVTTATSNFLAAGTHILGFRFLNEGTGQTNYGYVTINSSGGGTGFPLTIQGWSFENTGGAITVVPEASTTALLAIAALALGAVGVRKWRRQANAA
jgi:hypothetical protein